MIKVLKVTIIGVLSIVVLLFLIILRLYSIKIYDSIVQTRHLNNLVETYDDQYAAQDESEFINFDRYDTDLRLNEIQMLATHNSYKKINSPLGRLFVGLGDSFDEARAMKYGYKNLTDQLELGIRSMEFDIRKRKDSFVLTHVPLVDNSSVAPNFSMALDEIKLYSKNNPSHLPIIILVEIKDDWMMLDHSLQKIDKTELEELDQLMINKLGEQLFKPSDLMNDSLSVKETIELHGWPTVSSLLGKIMFVLHPNQFNEIYEQMDPSYQSHAMFIGSYASDLNHDYASFVIQNDVDLILIQQLVNDGFIVRTRVDENLFFDESRYQLAIQSGAQILSSDFTEGRRDLDQALLIDLSGYMVIKREEN